MNIEKFEIEGPFLIKLKTFHDNRGFFTERFNILAFEANGLPTNFIQDNFSRSSYGVLRGLHFQRSPAQGKLISCTNGEIFDVAVDIRIQSPTFGKYISVILNGDIPSLFWIPSGFAHGFCVTSKIGADVLYKVDAQWNAADEGCIAWHSKDLNISWPIPSPTVSDKDKKGLDLKQALGIKS